jgi:GntP family gluconate:H+ symporter/D-serine transporter
MQENAGLLLILLAAIVMIIVLVVKFRVHSFLALMLASFVVGAGAGL